MSDDDRRPRRIIAAPVMPFMQPQARPVSQPLLQQRFQRALSAFSDQPATVDFARRAAVERSRYDTVATLNLFRATPEPSPPAPPPPTAPQPPASTRSTQPLPDAARAKPRDTNAAAKPKGVRARTASSVAGGSLTRQDASAHDLPERPDVLADPQAWRLAGLAAPAPDLWDSELADRIATLCRRAPSSWSSWSVTVALDPAVLPQTELRMLLSLERLALRFHTHSIYSHALVERHRDRLADMLRKAMPGEREIDIETT
jgi:hypothetical protein